MFEFILNMLGISIAVVILLIVWFVIGVLIVEIVKYVRRGGNGVTGDRLPPRSPVTPPDQPPQWRQRTTKVDLPTHFDDRRN
jgi:hypothetical protein